MSGLTLTGFAPKSLEEIKSEIEASQIAALGPALVLEPDSLLGVLNGIVASKLAELWEVAQAVYASSYPDTASGIPLDNVGSITGAVRLEANKSAVLVTCTGTPGTVLPIGRVLSTNPAGDRFVSTAGAIIGGGGTVDVTFEAEQTGKVFANAGTLTVIETPVAGWASATNPADATLGRDQETDAEFRVRRLQLLALQGDGTVEAIRSQVLAVAGVNSAFVFENTSLVTDGDGLPGKAIEVVVDGGADADIAAAIFASKPAGILAHGVESIPVTDSQGFEHEIEFTRPTDVDFVFTNVKVEITSDAPADVDTLIAQAIADYFNNLPIGRDGYVYPLISAIVRCAPGIVNITVLDSVPVPTSNKWTILPRERAVCDPADVTVVLTLVPIE